MLINAILIAAAYLLGSIPSSIWIGHRFYGVDVREHGSHNAGATNTLRVLGKRAALPVFIIDFAKGFAAVMLSHLSAYTWGTDEQFNLKVILVAAAVLGHIFPIFADFKGGKGVATLAGATLAVYPPGVAVCFGVFLVVFLIWHYVSLGSISAGVMFPISVIVIFGNTSTSLILYSLVIAVLLIITHRPNIKRLLAGTESKTLLLQKK